MAQDGSNKEMLHCAKRCVCTCKIVHVSKALIKLKRKTAVVTLEASSLFGKCCADDMLERKLADLTIPRSNATQITQI
jgi:hypothetical protein